MTDEQINSLPLSEFMALRSRYLSEEKRRDKELRYILVAITGNKSLLQDSAVKPASMSELDRSAMEFSRRLADLGV